MAADRIFLTNQFLIAMPGMADDAFAGSVVYLCEHNDNGALGLVVNKPTTLTLGTITTAIQNVATMRAANGAEQSRLGFASELLTANKANLEAANSRIVDVDVAEESTQLARWNILVQSGTAMLSQANGSAQTALKLIS